MTSILVVCTGNVCRSPMAEGLTRNAFVRRLGDGAPTVSSAGTMGWEGSPAMPEAVEAAGEKGVDLRGHVARRLEPSMLRDADLVLAMAQEHREEIERIIPDAAGRTFTLKELTRLVEELPGDAGDLDRRLDAAAALRREGFEGNPLDEDISDPLGLPLDTYRAVAWELGAWIERLTDGLVGPVPARPDRAGRA
jgi:protein-tyrosine phosphatase